MADEWEGRDDWSSIENDLWENAFSGEALDDPYLQALYEAAYFEFDLSSADINFLRDSLDSYLQDNYGVIFDDVFDWEAYREAYGEAA